MTCILGPVINNEIKYYRLDNSLSKHGELREHRFTLIQGKTLYYFEVYRFFDKSRQVHCLLEDGSMVIFNKNNRKIITTILADTKLLSKYINKIPTGELTYNEIFTLKRCAKLNEAYKVNDCILSNEDTNKYMNKKKEILEWKNQNK